MKQQGSRDSTAIFDCVVGWDSFFFTLPICVDIINCRCREEEKSVTNKQKVHNIVKEASARCKDLNGYNLLGITARDISKALGLKRNYISHLLNELNRESKVIKINTRPVYFIDKTIFEQMTGKRLSGSLVYDSFATLEKAVLGKEQNMESVETSTDYQDPFSKFIGFDGSVKYQIEQCKAAIKYPPNGIPILINGKTGTGKSFLAQLMFQYAIQKKILPPEAPFLIFNCAEYVNNPELLSANLFGYAKGAFTGAERDFKGIIEQANGGYLFLDEIHRLPPEGQEKLFLFMDKGIFRRIGESGGWRKAKVRFIFATTENPETFLLGTFLRRIPIVINIPSLKERPLVEKIQLINIFFKEESQSLKKDLHISQQALKVLVTTDFKGNVGQLKNVIKFTCARAYNLHSNEKINKDYIEINLLTLPEHLSNSFVTDEYLQHSVATELLVKDLIIKSQTEDNMEVSSIINKKQAETYKTFFNNLAEFSKTFHKGHIQEATIDKLTVLIDDFFDHLILDKMQSYAKDDIRNIRFDTILNTIHEVFELIKSKYNLKYYDNIGYKIAGFVTQSIEHRYLIDLNGYDRKSKKYLDIVAKFFPREYGATQKISDFLKSNLDISLTPFERYVLLLYLVGMNKYSEPKRVKAVIIAHGFSTASSIANVANHLLGQNIFESFDMPVDVKTEEIIKQLKQYITEVDTSRGIIILVDMGSLEEIYDGLEKISEGVIGIVNNITTQLALDTGSQILQDLSVDEIIKRITENHRLTYKLIKPVGKKKKAIITTCITGIGTANKIKDLIIKSLGEYSKLLEVIAVDYLELKNKGIKNSIFSNLDVISIIGTQDPKVDNVPFFSLEDIISAQKEAEFGQILNEIIPVDGIKQINQSFIKYFSLESVLNHITILNPDKIVDQVEGAIEILQYELKVKFASDMKICLYIHLSCLIERLVTKTQINDYDKEIILSFKQCNQEFINIVKKSFSVIEKLYSVSIPVTEIYFIYQILKDKLKNR